MAEHKGFPRCTSCGRLIVHSLEHNAVGEPYHALCAEKERNDYYYEQTLDSDISAQDNEQ